jgi:hypothetical protein
MRTFIYLFIISFLFTSCSKDEDSVAINKPIAKFKGLESFYVSDMVNSPVSKTALIPYSNNVVKITYDGPLTDNVYYDVIVNNNANNKYRVDSRDLHLLSSTRDYIITQYVENEKGTDKTTETVSFYNSIKHPLERFNGKWTVKEETLEIYNQSFFNQYIEQSNTFLNKECINFSTLSQFSLFSISFKLKLNGSSGLFQNDWNLPIPVKEGFVLYSKKLTSHCDAPANDPIIVGELSSLYNCMIEKSQFIIDNNIKLSIKDFKSTCVDPNNPYNSNYYIEGILVSTQLNVEQNIFKFKFKISK